MVPISVREAVTSDLTRWNDFVSRSSESHLAHRFEWREIVNRCFGHAPYYLLAEEAGVVRGVLPLFLVSSFLFGRALISVPYLNGGGILSESAAAHRALVSKAQELLASKQVTYLELRGRAEDSLVDPSFQVRQHKVAMQLPLPSSTEAMLDGFKAKLRSQIKRPTKEGATARVISGDAYSASELSDFYQIFSANMRDLGTPTYPKQLFAETLRAFGASSRLVIVNFGNQPAAAGITLRHREIVEIPWASSLRSYNRMAPNMLCYWTAIEQAIKDGAKFFDFGRSSRDSATLHFKEQWGSLPLDLHWYYYSRSGAVPDVNPKSSKFALLVKAWRNLPLPVANLIGPWVTKSLP